VKRPWYAEGLHFECTGCGECCRQPGFVEVTEREAEQIARHLLGPYGTPEALEPLVWKRTPDGWEIDVPEGAVCPLLDPNGRCRVDPVKPWQCAAFPFWPDTLDSPERWREASVRCEGIGRGQRFDLVAIADALRGRRRV
jgi:Fe-S-cluster containining protein